MPKKILFLSLIIASFANFSFGQTAVSPTKKRLAINLMKTTLAIFPAEKIDALFKDVQAEKISETAKGITDSLIARIDSNDKLTTQEKADIKAKLPELSKKLTDLSMGFIGKDFTIKNWVNDSFQKYYSNKFTTAELRQLNEYFQSADGKKVVQMFNVLVIGGITDDKQKPSPQDDALMESFLKKRYAEKFFNVLLENILEEVMQKTDAWSKKALKEIDKSLENGELKKLIEDFVINNIKP